MISVIIPLYNAEKYILHTLNSLFNQTYKEFEVIIIDDCSTDNSLYLIENNIKNIQDNLKIKIIRNTYNKGPGVCRNIGIKEAKGEYVFFIDGDDLLSPDCFLILIDKINDNEAVVCSFDYINEHVICSPSIYLNKSDFYPKSGTYYGSDIFKLKILGTPWGKLIKKDFLLENNLFFSSAYRGEDTNWWGHCMLCFNALCILNDTPLYFYRKGHESLMKRNNEKEYLFNQDLLNINHTFEFIKFLKNKYNKNGILEFVNIGNNYLVFYMNFIAFRTSMFKRIFRYKLSKKKKYYENLRFLCCNVRDEIKLMRAKDFINNFHLLLPLKYGFIIIKYISKL